MTGIAVDAFLAYQFLKRLTTPFRDTQAYSLGIIDATGRKIRDPKTSVEMDSYRYFDRIVFNLKKLIEKIPGGKSKIATYAAALLLLREEDSRMLDIDVLEEQFDRTMRDLSRVDLPDFGNIREAAAKLRKLSTPRKNLSKFLKDREQWATLFKKPAVKEDAPANAVGGGAIAGVGVGSKGEPGVRPKLRIMLRRKKKYLSERLAKVDGKWALVSKKTGRPLAYYKGEDKPSDEWVARQERRVQYFKNRG